ncbi:hypothetical protein MPER_08089 [Moniliophthora perniciosa FA553]|nr:hypothetical protein MPER_08089 [Moniliophthora perniciosa FA553]
MMNVQNHTEHLNESGSDNDHISPMPTPPTSAQPKGDALAPKPSNSQRLSLSPDRPLDELIGEPFMPFDHQGSVVDPFTQEMNRDAAFEQELILETHAWSSARPKHESQMEVQKLEQGIMDVVEIEKEQGTLQLNPPSLSLSSVVEKTREQLNEFVSRMKKALAALAGL